jgi:hypothetical protein
MHARCLPRCLPQIPTGNSPAIDRAVRGTGNDGEGGAAAPVWRSSLTGGFPARADDSPEPGSRPKTLLGRAWDRSTALESARSLNGGERRPNGASRKRTPPAVRSDRCPLL